MFCSFPLLKVVKDVNVSCLGHESVDEVAADEADSTHNECFGLVRCDHLFALCRRPSFSM